MIETTNSTHICRSCGNSFTGDYCNECGEKILRPSDRSFKTFLSNILIAVTFADSKMIKTLWLVLKKPGFVSKEFANGRRVNYLKPISLFFVLNLIYFFFPVVQLFSASLNTQGMNVESFSLIYNLKTTAFAKLMVMVFVVLGSLPLNILYWKKNRFFTDHVSYVVELACFNLFINAIVLSILVGVLGAGKYLDEAILTGVFISTNLYFLLRSGFEFYGERGWRLVLKSALMILFLKLALEIYRMILFFVTIWSL
jgi:Protein of unknown function (DUF3667)